MKIIVSDVAEMTNFAKKLAQKLPAKFCMELIGDVGTGKTTLTKALVSALGSHDEVTSPSFAINNRYQVGGCIISHYDFYRLGEAGLMSQELLEDLADAQTSVIIEWAGVVEADLPDDRLRIMIETLADGQRQITLEGIDG